MVSVVLIEFTSILLGLIFGSFLSVCIYRIPLGRSIALGPDELPEEEPGLEDLPPLPRQELFEGRPISVAFPPRSFCPSCKTRLKWYHNIPLFSWLALRGRCAFCSTRIPATYPCVELLSAFFCWLSIHHFGLNATGVLAYAICAALIVVSMIDIEYFIIPNVLTFPGTALGIIAGILNHFFHFLEFPFATGIIDSALGALLGAGFLWVMAEGYWRIQGKVGMGLGDVKLLAFLGAFLGMWGSFYTIFLGSLVGSVVGILMILIGGRKMSHHLPFGPYLAAGALFYIFAHTSFLKAVTALVVPSAPY